MAQAPYNPVPSVSPSGQGTPFMRVPGSVEEASGSQVARATQGVGRELEQAGSTLAQNALALQHMQNETDANNADVAVMTAIGEESAKFDQLQGENAVKALPEYQKTIKKIRQDALAGASNPAVRKMLDTLTLRRVGFALVDAGHKAGTQARVAARKSDADRLEAGIMDYDPSKKGSFDLSYDTIEASVDALVADSGVSDPVAAKSVMMHKAISKMFLGGIRKQAPVDPEKAQELYDQVKDKLDPDTRDTALQIVNSNMAQKQSLNDTDEILKRGKFDPKKGPGQLAKLLEMGEEFAQRKGQDNPAYRKNLEVSIRSKVNVALSGYHDQQLGYMNQLSDYIRGEKDGDQKVSIESIRGPNAPKEMRDAYDALEGPKKERVLNWIKHSAEAPIRLTEDGLREYERLSGMMLDAESAPEAYNMGPDTIWKAKLPLADTRRLLEMQQKLHRSPAFFNNTLNQMVREPAIVNMLNAAGITKKQDEDAYNIFMSRLEDVLRSTIKEEGTMPPAKEREAIVSRLLTKVDSGAWFIPNSERFRGKNVPQDIHNEIIREYAAQGRPTPSDEQIKREHALMLYKRKYLEDQAEKKAASTKKIEPLREDF